MPAVVNCNVQLKAGRPSAAQDDTVSQRLQWFSQCLDALSSSLKALPIPWTCISFAQGLPGATPAEWLLYHSAINSFAVSNCDIQVVLVSDHAAIVAPAHSVLTSAAQVGVEAFTFASQCS